jgi:hypothetical protein
VTRPQCWARCGSDSRVPRSAYGPYQPQESFAQKLSPVPPVPPAWNSLESVWLDKENFPAIELNRD